MDTVLGLILLLVSFLGFFGAIHVLYSRGMSKWLRALVATVFVSMPFLATGATWKFSSMFLESDQKLDPLILSVFQSIGLHMGLLAALFVRRYKLQKAARQCTHEADDSGSLHEDPDKK